MTTESYLGSNVAAQLDLLTAGVSTALGIPLEMRLGTIEDARTGAPPRVTWVERDPGGLRYEECPFALLGLDLGWRECVDYDVHLWAGGAAELSAIGMALVAQVDIVCGPAEGSAGIDGNPVRGGYDCGKPSTGGPKVAAELAGNAYVVIPVTLKNVVSRLVFGSAAIQSVPVEIDLADATGSEEALPVAS